MRRTFFLFLLVVLGAPAALAQTTVKTGPEVFVGYSNLQAEGVPSQELNQNNSFDDRVFGERAGLHGVNAAVTGYLTERFGITGDFSLNQRSRNLNFTNGTGNIDTRVINIMGGPQVRFPNETRATPFVRALFGIVLSSAAL
jgi:hypothetical protein